MEEYDIRTKWRVKCLGMELHFLRILCFDIASLKWMLPDHQPPRTTVDSHNRRLHFVPVSGEKAIIWLSKDMITVLRDMAIIAIVTIYLLIFRLILVLCEASKKPPAR